MKTPPLVSVIIPTFNRPDLLPKAINSVINQTHTNVEIIVTDANGKGSDQQIATSKTIEKLISPKIKYLILEKKSGPSTARNYGIKHTKGEYIAFLDDDDEWMENKLKYQLKVLENYSACLCSAINIFNNSEKISFPKKRDYIKEKDFFRGGALGGQISALVVKSDVVKSLNFEEMMHVAEENIFLFCLMKKTGSIAYINKPLVKIYKNTGNLSNTNKSLSDKVELRELPISSDTKKLLGKYYYILLARIIIGANLNMKELSISKIFNAIRLCGLFPVTQVMYFKFLNFFTRKINPKYY